MKASIRISALVLIAMPALVWGQWQSDGVLLSADDPANWAVLLIPTDSGGAILVWTSFGNDGTCWDIYAQKLDAAGFPQWTPGGVPVCTAPGCQEFPRIASDGAGGVLVTWTHDFDRIFVQRVSSAGVPMWTPNGVLLCDIADTVEPPDVVSDDAGGAIVAWSDHRGPYYDIYAQRADASGAPLWTPNGVPVCVEPMTQSDVFIASDGNNGAIIVWGDSRNSSYDIYAQRLDSSGLGEWTASGVPVSTASGTQDLDGIVQDGSGGVIVGWLDWRTGGADIYAQRLDASGTAQWTIDGVAACTAINTQHASVITSDGVGGAILAWRDRRHGNDDIFAQRIRDNGSPMWTTNGVALCRAPESQFLPAISPDEAQGAVVSWNDLRNGNYDVYAQRVNATGGVEWLTDGIAVSALDSLETPPHCASDGVGGVIVAWADDRVGPRKAYAQHINRDGDISTPIGDAPSARGILLSPAYPNPSSSTTSFIVDISTASTVRIDVFDVSGKRVRRGRSEWVAQGTNELYIDGRDDTGRLLPSGVYFLRVQSAGEAVTRKMVIAR